VPRQQTAIQLITAVIDEAEGIMPPPPARVAAPCPPVIERDGKRYRLACPGCGLMGEWSTDPAAALHAKRQHGRP
jgi:hypothetical protein